MNDAVMFVSKFKYRLALSLVVLTRGLSRLLLQVIADDAEDYEKALPLYKRALEYFMTGAHCHLFSPLAFLCITLSIPHLR